MARKEGRNKNTNDVAIVNTVTINSVTPTTISVVNLNRIYFSATLAPGIDDVDAFVRLYPSAQDNIKHGEVLTRRLSGNDNLFTPKFTMMVDNNYTGEISAMSLNGTFDLMITEY